MKHEVVEKPQTLEEIVGREAKPARRRRRSGFARRAAIGAVLLLLVLAGTAAFFVWQLQSQRNSAFLRERFIGLITAGIGPGNQLMLEEAAMRLAGGRPTFSVGGLSINNPETGAYAELDQADVALSNLSLWKLSPEARSIRFEGLKLVLPKPGPLDNPLAANEALTLLRAVFGAVNFAVAGDDPAFRSLLTIEGRNIAIFRRETDGRTSLLRDNLVTRVSREGEDAIVARIGRAGIEGEIEFRARIMPTQDGGRSVSVHSTEVDAASLFRLFDVEVKGIDPALRAVLRVDSRQGAANELLETGISISARGGRIVPPDPDMTPFDLDEAGLDLRMRAGTSDLLIDRMQIRFGDTNILARGRAEPMPDNTGISLRLAADRAELDRLSPSEAPVALDRAALEGVIAPNLRSFTLNKLEIEEDAGRALLSGFFSFDNDGIVQARLQAQEFDLRKALRVWPIWIGSNVRRWMIGHVDGGKLANLTLQSELQGQALRDAQAHRPIPDEALRLSYRIEEGRMRPVLDAAPLAGIIATGQSTGRKANIEILSGWSEPVPGQRLTVRNARLQVANTALRPAILEMTLPAEGRLEALLAYASSPSLRSISGIPADIAGAEGLFSGQANITLPLAQNVAAKDMRIEMRADFRQVSIDQVVKGERLENGNFTLVSKGGQNTAKGDARIFGIPTQIEFKSEPGKPVQVQAKANLDDATLLKRGIDLRAFAGGPYAVTAALQLGKTNAPAEIEVDLGRAKIDPGIPALAKRPGQPAKAKFTLHSRPEGLALDNVEYDSGANSFRGRVEMLKDGQFGKAELATFRVSAGDNARLVAERVRGVLKLTLRGNSFDLRPFLRGFQSGRIDVGKPGDTKSMDFDLDLESTVLVGFNGELMSGADAKASRRNGRITQLQLRAKFGGAPVNANTGVQRGEGVALGIDTTDGGALLRFLDIYPRMFGGRLSADLTIGAQSQQGIVQMRDFVIRGEPSLRQVGGARSPGQTVVDGDEVPFTKLRADFVRLPGRLDLRESVMWGSQIGGTLEGTIDYSADMVSMKGVFVPAYALNNFFASVPLLGPILGGSQYEGLFAVPFIITGRASAPYLKTNPVSAIAPGFLRKFFEIQKETR